MAVGGDSTFCLSNCDLNLIDDAVHCDVHCARICDGMKVIVFEVDCSPNSLYNPNWEYFDIIFT